MAHLKTCLLILSIFRAITSASFQPQTFFEKQQLQEIGEGDPSSLLKDMFNCGKSSMGLPERRILNGKDTIEGDWPWVVFLNPGCTGSIITKRHVLTAAHCAYNITDKGEVFALSRITAIAGVSTALAEPIRSGGQSLYIKDIFIHPAYDYDDFATPDIAVFELAGEFRFSKTVRKICLPSSFEEDDGQIAFTVGWGVDQRTDGHNRTENSQEALIPLNPAKRCVDQFRNLTHHVIQFNSQNFICGGGTLRGTEIGDSGGPLMLNERGRWYQIGLTSFGKMVSNPQGLYFDVGAYNRIAEFCPWISKMTNYEAKCLDMRKPTSQQMG